MVIRKDINKLIKIIAILFSLSQIYFALSGIVTTDLQRHFHLAFAMILIFLIKPFRKGIKSNTIIPLDVILVFLALGSLTYLRYHYHDVVLSAGALNNSDLFVGIIVILLVLEAVRRAVGVPLTIVAIISLVYSFYGYLIPGFWGHAGHSINRIISAMDFGMSGIYGTPIGVVVSFVMMFVIFGTFLEVSGAGEFVINFARTFSARLKGGEAKTAVIASALMGMISGSSVANVVTTGSFTIPLMKKSGFSSEYAAAIETASSIGGPLTPPIMGAAAFLIMAFTGIPYKTICLVSIIPVFLYFLTVFSYVHFKACTLNLKTGTFNWSEAKDVLVKGIPFLLPLILLMSLLILNYTPITSITMSLLALIIIASIMRRMDFNKILEALEKSARRILVVSTACAGAGIVVGTVELTGLGAKFTSIIVSASGGNLFFALLLVALACFFLGMGLPITSAYIITAVIAVPALAELGVPLLIAHLAVFWLSIVSAVTPPVCITSYAAAGVANSDPIKTALLALKMAKGLFIVPMLMVFTPIMLNGDLIETVLAILTGGLGLVMSAAFFEGFFITQLNPVQRLLLLAIAILLLLPYLITDIIGLFMVLVFVVFISRSSKKKCSGNKIN